MSIETTFFAFYQPQLGKWGVYSAFDVTLTPIEMYDEEQDAFRHAQLLEQEYESRRPKPNLGSDR